MTQAPSHEPSAHTENGAKIRRARELVRSSRFAVNHRPDRPISQQDFAAVLGISRRHQIRLENGEHLPSGELRDRIVALTGTEERIESEDDEDEDAQVQAFIAALELRIALCRRRNEVGA